MQRSILITNGGPHPAEKWAEATASHIVQVAEHVAGERRAAAVKLEAAVIDVLERHHKTVQDGERGKLKSVGHDRLMQSFNCEEHVMLDHVVVEIVAAAKGTPWEADFAKPEAQEGVRSVLRSHFHTSMHIERSWHVDRNTTAPQAVVFRNTYHPGASV